MKAHCQNKCIAVTALLIALGTASSAQVQLQRSVVAGGAVQAGNVVHRIAGTIGQTVIGASKNSSSTAHQGFWYNRENVMVSVDRFPGEAPETFALDDIYPNPLSPRSEVRIGFRIPERAQIRLAIVDVLGNRIALLIDEKLDAGDYSARFRPSTLPNGTYFAVLQSAEIQVVRKMIVVD